MLVLLQILLPLIGACVVVPWSRVGVLLFGFLPSSSLLVLGSRKKFLFGTCSAMVPQISALGADGLAHRKAAVQLGNIRASYNPSIWSGVVCYIPSYNHRRILPHIPNQIKGRS